MLSQPSQEMGHSHLFGPEPEQPSWVWPNGPRALLSHYILGWFVTQQCSLIQWASSGTRFLKTTYAPSMLSFHHAIVIPEIAHSWKPVEYLIFWSGMQHRQILIKTPLCQGLGTESQMPWPQGADPPSNKEGCMWTTQETSRNISSSTDAFSDESNAGRLVCLTKERNWTLSNSTLTFYKWGKRGPHRTSHKTKACILHRNPENFCWTMFHRAVPKAGQKMQRTLGCRQSTPGTGEAVGELSSLLPRK